ncbi:hypothetical protein ABZX74_11755 [Streptomyces olivaceoviridis]|uniref:hypothetical protein n=1 Tax=Streptomyces olivaceoviridis TaxID=1921 RepID=UPI0033A3BAA0
MLEADTTVPQCLDNQFVTDETFMELSQNPKLDYSTPEIASARDREARTEFIRALVYSSQVVVDRAFMVNSPIIYRNYLPGMQSGIASFAELLRGNGEPQAIVPYLHTQHSLREPLPSYAQEDTRGRAALEALLDYAGEPVSVRFRYGDGKNEKEVRKLEHRFAAYLKGQLDVLTEPGNEEEFNEMAAELFGERHYRIEDPEAWERFRARVRALSRLAYEGGKVTRSRIYESMLVRGDSPKEKKENTAKGRFLNPETDEGEFVFEVKKLVDLVFNANLSDQMHRYVFTPAGMPTRVALQDFNLSAVEAEGGIIDEAEQLKAGLSHLFMANMQQAMDLPLLGDLTVEDVVAIRKLSSWHEFSNRQQDVLRHPLEVLERLEDFTVAFNDFQSDLSRWYFSKYQKAPKVERYANFATIALQIGGSTLVALGFPGHDAASLLAHSAVSPVIPKIVKAPTIKLMVYVVDLVHRCVDPRRSYSIELMQTQADCTRQEVLELVRKFSGNTIGESVYEDRSAALLSDQGK